MRHLPFLLLLTGLLAGCGLTDSPKGTAKRPAIPDSYHPPMPVPTEIDTTKGDPWTTKDLLAPAVLAAQLRSGSAPVVFDMGSAGTILNARKIGPAQEKASIERLRTALQDMPKDQPVVVYCGCCPFEPCPNIRPAFRLLQAEGFQKPRLLNLPHNLKADWIDKGYPMARGEL